jgi:hypothetical protein
MNSIEITLFSILLLSIIFLVIFYLKIKTKIKSNLNMLLGDLYDKNKILFMGFIVLSFVVSILSIILSIWNIYKHYIK